MPSLGNIQQNNSENNDRNGDGSYTAATDIQRNLYNPYTPIMKTFSSQKKNFATQQSLLSAKNDISTNTRTIYPRTVDTNKQNIYALNTGMTLTNNFQKTAYLNTNVFRTSDVHSPPTGQFGLTTLQTESMFQNNDFTQQNPLFTQLTGYTRQYPSYYTQYPGYAYSTPSYPGQYLGYPQTYQDYGNQQVGYIQQNAKSLVDTTGRSAPLLTNKDIKRARTNTSQHIQFNTHSLTRVTQKPFQYQQFLSPGFTRYNAQMRHSLNQVADRKQVLNWSRFFSTAQNKNVLTNRKFAKRLIKAGFIQNVSKPFLSHVNSSFLMKEIISIDKQLKDEVTLLQQRDMLKHLSITNHRSLNPEAFQKLSSRSSINRGVISENKRFSDIGQNGIKDILDIKYAQLEDKLLSDIKRRQALLQTLEQETLEMHYKAIMTKPTVKPILMSTPITISELGDFFDKMDEPQKMWNAPNNTAKNESLVPEDTLDFFAPDLKTEKRSFPEILVGGDSKREDKFGSEKRISLVKNRLLTKDRDYVSRVRNNLIVLDLDEVKKSILLKTNSSNNKYQTDTGNKNSLKNQLYKLNSRVLPIVTNRTYDTTDNALKRTLKRNKLANVSVVASHPSVAISKVNLNTSTFLNNQPNQILEGNNTFWRTFPNHFLTPSLWISRLKPESIYANIYRNGLSKFGNPALLKNLNLRENSIDNNKSRLDSKNNMREQFSRNILFKNKFYDDVIRSSMKKKLLHDAVQNPNSRFNNKALRNTPRPGLVTRRLFKITDITHGINNRNNLD